MSGSLLPTFDISLSNTLQYKCGELLVILNYIRRRRRRNANQLEKQKVCRLVRPSRCWNNGNRRKEKHMSTRRVTWPLPLSLFPLSLIQCS
jgi:hypothetical protein